MKNNISDRRRPSIALIAVLVSCLAIAVPTGWFPGEERSFKSVEMSVTDAGTGIGTGIGHRQSELAGELVTLRIMNVLGDRVTLEIYNYVPASTMHRVFRDGIEVHSSPDYFQVWRDEGVSTGSTHVYRVDISNATNTWSSLEMTVTPGLLYGYTWEEDVTIGPGTMTVVSGMPWYNTYTHTGFDVCFGNLTVLPGTTIFMANDSKIWVDGGGLIASSSSAGNPIEFIGLEDGRAQIELSTGAYGNVFRNCTFVDLKGLVVSNFDHPDSTRITDCTFMNNTFGVYSMGCSPRIEGCTFWGNGIGVASREGSNLLTGAKHHGTPVIRRCQFNGSVHDAVVNYDPLSVNLDARYNWWGSPTGPRDATGNPGGLGENVLGKIQYLPWQGLDPRIEKLDIIQVVPNHPLVSGKPILVRVYLGTEQPLNDYTVTLRVNYAVTGGTGSLTMSSGDKYSASTRRGATCPDPYLPLFNKWAVAKGTDSVNFFLPMHLIPTGAGTIGVSATLNLQNGSYDGNQTNNVMNRTLPVNVEKGTLAIMFVPINVAEWKPVSSSPAARLGLDPADLRTYLTAANKQLEFIKATYPVTRIISRVATSYKDIPNGTQGENLIEMLHSDFKGTGFDRIVGVFPPTYADAIADGYDGLAYEHGLIWKAFYTAVLALSTDSRSAAHELGHTFGLPAVGKGGEEYNLPRFTMTTGGGSTIQMGGIEAPGWWVEKGQSGCAYSLPDGKGYHCFMGNMPGATWICRDDYARLYEHFCPNTTSTSRGSGSRQADDTSFLALTGSIRPPGNLTGNNSTKPAPGNVTLDLDIQEIEVGETTWAPDPALVGQFNFTLAFLDQEGAVLSTHEIPMAGTGPWWFHIEQEIPAGTVTFILALEDTMVHTGIVSPVAGPVLSTASVLNETGTGTAAISVQWYSPGNAAVDIDIYTGEGTWWPVARGATGTSGQFPVPRSILASNSSDSGVVGLRAVRADVPLSTPSYLNFTSNVQTSTMPVFIDSPAEGETVAAGVEIVLVGMAISANGSIIDSTGLTWHSDLDGLLATGSPAGIVLVTPGEHHLTLEAADDLGHTATATVVVHVGIDATPPVIFLPGEILVTGPGGTLDFSIEVSDIHPSDFGLVSLNGTISTLWGGLEEGENGRYYRAVAVAPPVPGQYHIEIEIADQSGNIAHVLLPLVVIETTLPVSQDIIIVTPVDGRRISPGIPVEFMAVPSGLEQGDCNVRWTSSIDGPLGTGLSISALLSPGNHNILAEKMLGGLVFNSTNLTLAVGVITPLDAPANPVVSSGEGNTLYLSWTAPANIAGFRGYVVEVAPVGNGGHPGTPVGRIVVTDQGTNSISISLDDILDSLSPNATSIGIDLWITLRWTDGLSYSPGVWIPVDLNETSTGGDGDTDGDGSTVSTIADFLDSHGFIIAGTGGVLLLIYLVLRFTLGRKREGPDSIEDGATGEATPSGDPEEEQGDAAVPDELDEGDAPPPPGGDGA